jgi:hypothetical protein
MRAAQSAFTHSFEAIAAVCAVLVMATAVMAILWLRHADE